MKQAVGNGLEIDNMYIIYLYRVRVLYLGQGPKEATFHTSLNQGVFDSFTRFGE